MTSILVILFLAALGLWGAWIFNLLVRVSKEFLQDFCSMLT